MASRPRSPIASPLRVHTPIEQLNSPQQSQTLKENGASSPLIDKGSQKRPRESEEPKYNLRQPKLSVPADSQTGYLSPNTRSPVGSPKRSPRLANKSVFTFNGESQQDKIEEIEYKEELNIFGCIQERLRAYWLIPFKKIQSDERKSIRYTTDSFPAETKKKWRFIAEIEKENNRITKFYISIECVLDEREAKNPDWKRENNLALRVLTKKSPYDAEKAFNRTFSNKCKDSGVIHQDKGLADISLASNDCLIIECTLRDNKTIKSNSTDFLGLVNAGNTCYMNSFLQTLYHLGAFTRTVYKTPFSAEKSDAISTAMQKLFYSLKCSKKSVPTTELIKSFGWDKKQAWVQQDVQEFCCLLLEALDEKTRGIENLDGAILELFRGEVLNYVHCINVEYWSSRIEKFIEVQLMVKGMKNIYQSLDHYILEEILEGDNKYEAGEYGKQEARKGILFQKLPPVLMLYLKRFEYDYEKDSNVKITDPCEYYDEIDLKKYVVAEYAEQTEYKLFSVLVHSGTGAQSGHYYAFIRPNSNDRWYKFNDDLVDVAETEDVFESNFGGTHSEAKLNPKKEIESTEALNQASAYMLVYVRKNQCGELLKPITSEDIPTKLIEDIEKNKKNDEERVKRKKGEEFFKFYITSPEILMGQTTPGLAFYKMGSKDDEYAERFLRNKSKRLKVYFKKTAKVFELQKFISENTGIPQNEIMLWKITVAKEQITQVLKKSFLNTTGPNVLVLANGVNSNQTKSIFIANTISKDKYPSIFLQREKYVSNFSDIQCKNQLDFVKYQTEIEMDIEGNKATQSESDKSDSIKVEKILEGASQTFLDLLDEKLILVFLKRYTYIEKISAIKLEDYVLIPKDSTGASLTNLVQQTFPELATAELNLYREERKKYTLELIKLEEKIDDGIDSAQVIVFETKEADMEYVNAQSHYTRLSNRVWVNFVPGVFGNNAYKDILDGSTPYNEIVEIVSRTVFGGETPANKIILKAKWKNSGGFHPVPHNNNPPIKLSELVKYEEKIQCEISKIEVGLLDKKLKCLIYYFSIVSNARTNDEEIYIDKSSTIKDLINEIVNKEVFKTERDGDLILLNKPAKLRVMLLEKKKNKLIARTSPDQSVNTLSTKYKMRIEYIPEEFEAEAPDETRYYPVYCIHTTRDGEIFSNPFLFFIQRNVTTLEFKTKLYEHIKDWEIWADKKVTINDEFFAKVRFVLKSEISDTKICKLETGILIDLNH